MRDKKAVDEYKASIKAQLSRAGLIRGQPRINGVHPSPPPPRRHPNSQTRRSTVSSNASRLDRSPSFTSAHQPVEVSFVGQSNFNNQHLIPTVPVPPTLNYETPLTFDDTYEPPNFFHPNTLGIDAFSESIVPNGLDFPLEHPRLTDYTTSPAQPTMHDLVMHYFNNVRQVQLLFAGDALNDVTYTAVLNEPQGAVSLAICALADLHLKQLRVAQGLEAPSQTPDNSSTSYLRLEALSRLEINKNSQRGWTDNDALAALHLISLSQLSGGTSDWETPFDILIQWLHQTNLRVAENPWLTFLSLPLTAQLNVKATLWVDIFSSLSRPQPPKLLSLWQTLLNGDQSSFWMNGSDMDIRRLRMDLLTGCPDEVMLAIAETSSLAQWKALQLRNNCLSFPELIRRGNNVEQQLRQRQSEHLQGSDVSQTRLLVSASATLEDNRSVVANIFRETALLYLHTVLSNALPGVPEISASVEALIQLFSRLPPSDLDRGLIFPICLAACMTNDSTRRDFFKNRIRNMNESFGNLLQIRRLMEAVWQKRDIRGGEADLREIIQEQGLKLLLI